jgi:GntR family transcriptional regulator, transcriptional repressor for pyruvate dehydrogenase complex
MLKPQIVVTSVHKQIAESIRTAILEGRLKGDQRLPTEGELAAQYGVSRPTIREALKRLAAQNLIRSKRGPAGGNFVHRPNLHEVAETLTTTAMLMVTFGNLDMEEIADARLEMEIACCKLAVQRWSRDDRDALESALRHQRTASLTDEEFCAADVRFHRLIADATGNTMLRFLMYAVIEALVPITNMVIVFVRDRTKIISYHQAILDGYARKDCDAMAAGLCGLMDYLRKRSATARAARERRETAR